MSFRAPSAARMLPLDFLLADQMEPPKCIARPLGVAHALSRATEENGLPMELSTPLNSSDGYRQLLQQISDNDTYTQGRVRAVQAVNSQLVETYWQVGRHIVEFEQAGQVRAEYGKALIDTLATDLGLRHGKGFSRSNLIRFRQFYLAYPDLSTNGATLSHQLNWSHIVELLKIDDPLERGFYEQQALRERWSVRELVRQKDSALFLQLAASQGKAGILQLAQQGQVVEQPTDLLREPYVFEFLKIPEPYQLSETQLETLLCDHLQPFLLEQGKGFTFVGRPRLCDGGRCLPASAATRQIEGQRAPALRFGDANAQAALKAVLMFVFVARGFTNKDLRQQFAVLLGKRADEISPGRMSYELRRLRMHGLIERVPKTHRYRLTDEGLRTALFYTRVYTRILRPAMAPVVPAASASSPQALRQFHAAEDAVNSWCDQAHIATYKT